jgi:hypothetical protein
MRVWAQPPATGILPHRWRRSIASDRAAGLDSFRGPLDRYSYIQRMADRELSRSDESRISCLRIGRTVDPINKRTVETPAVPRGVFVSLNSLLHQRSS